MSVTTVVFDLGGVLIDWNPRYLYERLLGSAAEAEDLIRSVALPSWNHQLDGGRRFDDVLPEWIAAHPEHAELIRAYRQRWHETVSGANEDVVAILSELNDLPLRLYALSNWGREPFYQTRPRFPFLDWFDGVVISGEEGVTKPDPRIYRILIDRFDIQPRTAVFIDDLEANVRAADDLEFRTIRFRDAPSLRRALREHGLPIADVQRRSSW